MDTQAFYTTVSTISFTLLGLWWVVVQGRETWRVHTVRRRMSYVISLHFLLPGVMSVLSLVAPDVAVLWRITFVAAGILGLIGAGYVARALAEEYDAPPFVRLIEWVAAPVYLVIALVAVAPEMIGSLGIPLSPLQVEGIMLSLILFFGVQAAWILTVEPPRQPTA